MDIGVCILIRSVVKPKVKHKDIGNYML